jgi:hypothetical protein
LEPIHTNKIHQDDQTWLECELQKCRDEGQEVCVFTHHAPMEWHTQCVEMRKGGSGHGMKYLDFSDQRKLLDVNEHVKVWGFGHTHYSTSQIHNKTKV